MTRNAPSQFIHEPDPHNPGWHSWDLNDPARFNGVVMGKLLVRRESERTVTLRMLAEARHSNLHDNIHGGVTLSLIDIALFTASRIVCGPHVDGSVSLELNNTFIGAGRIGQPLDAVTEVLRETGRLVFLRGVVMQADHMVASFTGTMRKPGRKPAREADPAT